MTDRTYEVFLLARISTSGTDAASTNHSFRQYTLQGRTQRSIFAPPFIKTQPQGSDKASFNYSSTLVLYDPYNHHCNYKFYIIDIFPECFLFRATLCIAVHKTCTRSGSGNVVMGQLLTHIVELNVNRLKNSIRVVFSDFKGLYLAKGWARILIE